MIEGLLIALLIISAAALAVSVVVFIRQGKATSDKGDDGLRDALRADIKEDIVNTVRVENAMLTGTVNTLVATTKATNERFDKFMINVDHKLDVMKDENARNLLAVKEDNATKLGEVIKNSNEQLEAVRRDNSVQLEKMRETVNQKLTETLEQQFSQSFKLVGERLNEINATFNALQGLQNDVTDLNKIFKNVKTRGTWGEVSLENLLSQILTPDQFIKQAKLVRGESEEGRVDFAIKIPRGEGESTLIPVDAKFPLEDYERLVEASNGGNVALVDGAVKALCDAVIKQARSIRDKYVHPPKTTDFAVMYLPVEGLYSEVVKRTELLSKLQNDCKVMVCGPTTLAALLNSLRLGLRSVAIVQKSNEIAKVLAQFQKDFGKFSEYLEKLQDRMGTMQKSIDVAKRKSDSIGKQLSGVTHVDLGDGGADNAIEGYISSEFDAPTIEDYEG